MMNFDIIISMSSSFGIIRKVMKEDFVLAHSVLLIVIIKVRSLN